uniref:Uncharacterized protein n=1 Tax=Fagus sylvatica TaxID=28930 RepID=A0A2N9GEF1_FAGSY
MTALTRSVLSHPPASYPFPPPLSSFTLSASHPYRPPLSLSVTLSTSHSSPQLPKGTTSLTHR